VGREIMKIFQRHPDKMNLDKLMVTAENPFLLKLKSPFISE
jgi:hypothetical protein